MKNFHRFFNSFSTLMFLSITVFLLIYWKKIPDELPSSLNANDKETFDKIIILYFYFFEIIIYAALTILKHFPKVWNTGVQLTSQNSEEVYAILNNLLATVKFIVVFYVNYFILQFSLGFKIHVIYFIVFWFIIIIVMTLFIKKLINAK